MAAFILGETIAFFTVIETLRAEAYNRGRIDGWEECKSLTAKARPAVTLNVGPNWKQDFERAREALSNVGPSTSIRNSSGDSQEERSDPDFTK